MMPGERQATETDATRISTLNATVSGVVPTAATVMADRNAICDASAIKPIGCRYKREFMYRYGFPAAVVAHVMWDAWLMAGPALIFMLAAPIGAFYGAFESLIRACAGDRSY